VLEEQHIHEHGPGARMSTLPDYSTPPVTEVALSVLFEPLPSLLTPQYGLFWSRLRNAFPRVEERGPIEPQIERFGERPNVAPSVRFLDRPVTPRCWFLNEAGSELIQLQQDQLIHNWRKIDEGASYPHFEHVSSQFRKDLAMFEAFVRDEKLGDLIPKQCEITYVNRLTRGEGWKTLGQVELVSTLWRKPSGFLPEPEDVRFGVRYLIPDAKGSPFGRLHVMLNPVFDIQKNDSEFILTLTARGKPQGEGSAGVMSFLEIGHEWIVRGFDALTQPSMHELWGKK